LCSGLPLVFICEPPQPLFPNVLPFFRTWHPEVQCLVSSQLSPFIKVASLLLLGFSLSRIASQPPLRAQIFLPQGFFSPPKRYYLLFPPHVTPPGFMIPSLFAGGLHPFSSPTRRRFPLFRFFFVCWTLTSPEPFKDGFFRTWGAPPG